MKKSLLGLLTLFLAVFLVSQAIPGTWTSNNFIYKPSVGARGTTEKNSYDAGLDRVDARLGKEIWVGDPAYGSTIQNAITTISGANACLRMAAGTHTISANLTVPANVTLRPERGALLAINNGITLTINGSLEAGPYQIFSCTGTGNVAFPTASAAGTGTTTMVYPQWFGAKGDASTDDYAAFASAIAATPSNGILAIPRTTYKIGTTLAITKPMNIKGLGSGQLFAPPSFLWSGGASPMMTITLANAVNLENVYFDCNNTATYGIDVDRMINSRWQSIKVGNAVTACLRLMVQASRYVNDNIMGNHFEALKLIGPIGLVMDSAVPTGATSSDSCLNTFMDLNIAYTGSYGMDIVVGDGNNFYNTYIYRNSGAGKGIHFSQDAWSNIFYTLTSSGGCDVDAPRYESFANMVFFYDIQSGSVPEPTIAAGAEFYYTTNEGYSVWNTPRIAAKTPQNNPTIIAQNTNAGQGTQIRTYDSTTTRYMDTFVSSTESGLQTPSGEAIFIKPGGSIAAKAMSVTAPQLNIRMRANAPPDGELSNQFACFWLDEGSGNLKAKAKYAAGTVVNGIIPSATEFAAYLSSSSSYADPSWLTSLNATKLSTGTGGVSISAGGTNQNVTLTPSGTGLAVINKSAQMATANAALVGADGSGGAAFCLKANSGGWSTSAATGDTVLRSGDNQSLILQNGGAGAGVIIKGSNVGIGTAPNTAALLHLNSTTKGFLPPVMTTAQRTAISTPPEGLMVYDSTLHNLCFYNGTNWQKCTTTNAD